MTDNATDKEFSFAGVWRSTYHKAGEDSPVATEQYVTMRKIGNQLILESIPGANDAYLMAKFSIDGRVLTGSYQSQNSPNNSTKNALYYGAAQMVVAENGMRIEGMGVGFGKNMEIKSTVWQLEHIGQHAPGAHHA